MRPNTSLSAIERQTLVAQFDRSMGLLRQGDATRPLFMPWDSDVRAAVAGVGS